MSQEENFVEEEAELEDLEKRGIEISVFVNLHHYHTTADRVAEIVRREYLRHIIIDAVKCVEVEDTYNNPKISEPLSLYSTMGSPLDDYVKKFVAKTLAIEKNSQ